MSRNLRCVNGPRFTEGPQPPYRPGSIHAMGVHPEFPKSPEYRHVIVDQESFEKHMPRDFVGLVKTFREFQE